MLYVLCNFLILVELKAEDNTFAFFTDANNQLKSTINFIKSYNIHELDQFIYKSAYIANRVRPTNHSICESHTKIFLEIAKDVPNNVIDIEKLITPPI